MPCIPICGIFYFKNRNLWYINWLECLCEKYCVEFFADIISRFFIFLKQISFQY